MKKLSVFLLCGLLSSGTVFAQPTNGYFDNGTQWSIMYDVLTIIGDGPMQDFDVSDELPWKDSKALFSTVEIEEGITHVGNFVFHLCENIISVSIPGSVITIGNDAFTGCLSLSSISVATTNPAYYSDDGVLFDKDQTTLILFPSGKTGDYIIPSSVEVISDHSFIFCLGLTAVTIPSSVTTIGDNAFFFCESLISVAISASVSSIGDFAFTGCNALTEIINLREEPQDTGSDMFFGADYILNTCTLRVPAHSTTAYRDDPEWGKIKNIEVIEVDINMGTTEMFYFMISYTPVQLDATVTGDVTHPELISWRSSNPDVVTVDHTGTFTVIRSGSAQIIASIGLFEASCKVTVFEYGGLSSTIYWGIQNGILSIFGNGAMTDYTSPNDSPSDHPAPWYVHKDMITSVEIEEKVTEIGDYAFFNMDGITSVSIPGSVNRIGASAFAFCEELATINIPSSVTVIGHEALTSCAAMTSITVDTENLSYMSIDGVLFSKDGKTLITFPSGKRGSYIIPETVETIGRSAFLYCIRLSSVTISNSVTTISDENFVWCPFLTSVTISNSVLHIGYLVFSYCYQLTTINIPASVTFIGDQAFSACSSLSEITNTSIMPQVFTEDNAYAFAGVPFATCILRVPAASVNLYREAEIWKNFEHIVALDAVLTLDEEEVYLLCGSTMTMTINGGELSNPYAVIWMSDNPTVADVDPNGTITAYSPGKAMIVANDGISPVICWVTVIEQGTSSIEGTVVFSGNETVTVNLYIKQSDPEVGISLMKVGGYILLAKTTTNASGQYSFNDLPPGDYLIDVEIDDFDSEFSPEITLSFNDVRTGINFTVDSNTHTIIQDVSDVTTETEVFTSVSLKVYPNPFVGHLCIEGAEGCTLMIFAIDGRPVHAQMVTGTTETVHLEHLPAGIYIIRMENRGRATTVKVVKR